MKPYRSIPIQECGEPLIAIPTQEFVLFRPHPYEALGAPYGAATPWMLRQEVLAALQRAQSQLTTLRHGWKFMIFDAYRPNTVQAFMVEREFATQAELAGLTYTTLTPEQRESLAPKVFRLWGIPSMDPATPPPHSTGAAIDLTLADEHGREVPMGSPIDENSDRSNPDYFIAATDPVQKMAHENRVFLHNLMHAQGFHRAFNEWWHFSLGDQMWAYDQRQKKTDSQAIARYGRADLLNL